MEKIKVSWILIGLIVSILILPQRGYSYKNEPQKIRIEEPNTCLCRGDLDHNGVINHHDLKLMLKIIRGEISLIPPYECGDLDYNFVPYEMADYSILWKWVNKHHAIQCKRQRPPLISLKISEYDAKPCEMVALPIFIQNDVTIGAFDLWIEFDCTLLYPCGAERGEVLTYKDSTETYQWEFFTYRQLPNPNSLMYHLEIFAVYDIRDNHQGIPLQPNPDSIELAKIKFKVACDDNLLGTQIPVNFYWNPENCTENSLSDQTGYILFVSNDTAQFNFIDCDTVPGANPIIPSVDFENGLVNIPETPEKQIGDLNLNHIPYEVPDAVLFLSYFIEGTAVFTIDSAQQIANSDIDGNGEVLTLSDFVLMTKIMLNAAKPGDTTGYSDKIAYYTTSVRDPIFLFSFNSEAPVGAALFTFDCSDTLAMPYLYSTNMDLIYKINNNELRVLVTSLGGANIPSGPVDLLAIPLENACTLTSLEVVDDKGNIMEARLGTTGISDQPVHDLPKSFALLPNHPNPFNPDTYIEYALPFECQVTLEIYNILGQKVKTLVNELQLAGYKSIKWDGKDDSGNLVSTGIYFYSLKADNFYQTKKMLLLK